jgi:DNA polymerase-3 subunit alpha
MEAAKGYVASNEALKTGSTWRKRKSDCSHDDPHYLIKAARRKAERGTHKPMRFVSLHHHSTYSSLDGFQLPDAHVRRATEINMGAIAMTEHGNVSSHDGLEKAAKAMGVKPIYGCEVYTGRVGEGATQRKYHLTILAANPTGYHNLLALVSRSWSEGFHYEPTVSWDMLKEHKEGLIILSGCQGSLLFCSMVGGKLIPKEQASYARARKVARAFKREFGDNYYIEVQAFPSLRETRLFNPLAEKLGKELGIGVVGTMDCHYTIPEEREVQMLLHNLRPGNRQTLEEQVRDWGYDEFLCPPPNDRSIYRRLRDTGMSDLGAQEAIINTEIINQRIVTFDLPRLPMLRFPLPPGYDSSLDLWRDEIRKGWEYRGINRMPKAKQKIYKERLKREAKIIEGKDFQDYFLVVGDMVRWAKDNEIPVGPARGSAAASLICFLLRITEVDPIVFDTLVFERFIDESRADLPDIDLDFDSDRRHEVREYLVGKYGEECVNNIGTFNYFKSKNSLDDVARVYRVPKYKIDIVKDLLVERSSGDLRASATIEDTVEQFDEAKAVFEEHPELYKSRELEGNIKSIGVHAAGLVVSNGPITDVCAVYERKVKGVMTRVVSLDKYDAERRGLVKIDALGLSTMALIADAMKHIGMKVADLYDLPFDDPVVIDGFRRNDVIGIFQFDGRSTRSICGALKPDNFKEVCDVNALSRPGPLHNGAATAYIDIKRGVMTPELVHPVFDEITKEFQYQIIYQEQILRIVREIGDFDWTHAAYIRKIISLKKGDGEFNRQYDRYWQGAQRRHPDMSEEVARHIWNLCTTAGSYAFNLAHTISYGMLAYWTMWIKQHHPEVFYASALSKLSEKKQESLLRDASKRNGPRRRVKAMAPDPSHSALSWVPVRGEGRIHAGFRQVPGIGEKTAEAIMEYRKANGIKSWADLVAIKGIGPKTVEKFEEFASAKDPFGVYTLDKKINRAKKFIESTDGELPMPTHTSLEIPYERGPDTEVVWIGTVRDRNIRDIFEANRARGEALEESEVKDAHLNEWAMLIGDDGDELVTVRIDRHKYPKFKKAIFGIKPGEDLILIQGVKPGFRSAKVVYVNKMWVLSD